MPSQASPYLLYYSPGAASMAVHWMLIEMGIPFDAHRVDIDAGQQHDPVYRRLNPSGRVPTLIVDGAPRHESAALLMLLAERHPEALLAPEPNSAERAAWLEMMVYLANTVLPAMRDWFYADTDGEPDGAQAVRALARRRIEAACEKLDAHLGATRGEALDATRGEARNATRGATLDATRDETLDATRGETLDATRGEARNATRDATLDTTLAATQGEPRDYLIGDRLTTADLLAVVLMRWTRNMPRPALGWPQLARYIRGLRALPSFIELNAREGLTEWRNEDD